MEWNEKYDIRIIIIVLSVFFLKIEMVSPHFDASHLFLFWSDIYSNIVIVDFHKIVWNKKKLNKNKNYIY